MTNRLWFLVLVVYFLVVLGLIARSGSFFILAFPFLVYIWLAFLSSPGGVEELEATRSLSASTLIKDKTTTVELAVTNHGRHSIGLLIEDRLSAQIEVIEGETRVLAWLPPHGRIDLSYTLRGRRGVYHFSPIQATTLDDLGLLEKRVSFQAPARLTVLPDVQRLHPIPFRPMHTHEYSGMIPSRHAGAGIDFFDVRGYQLGDPMRWVNWKKSSRHPEQLYITEFEQERIADIGLILDARDQSNVIFPDDSLFDHAVVATASLADCFLRYGNRVGLLVYGRGNESTFPGYGKLQREKILRTLAWADTGEDLVLESLSYLPTQFFPPHSQIFLVSPLHKEDLPVLLRLRAHGYQVVVISPDPVEFEAGRMRMERTDRAVRLAERMARLERNLLIHKLLRVGVPVVDWKVSQSLDRTLQRNLGHLAANFSARRVGIG